MNELLSLILMTMMANGIIIAIGSALEGEDDVTFALPLGILTTFTPFAGPVAGFIWAMQQNTSGAIEFLVAFFLGSIFATVLLPIAPVIIFLCLITHLLGPLF